MTEKKKLSTAEILAMARQQKAGGAAGSPAESAEAPAAPPAEAPTPAAPSESPAKPAATPKSTADILAAARAQKGPAAEKPSGTADILAAARAQGSGAAKPATAPKSTADILAAARAGKGGSAPAAAAPKAAAPKKAAATAAPSGDRPPLKDMVAVVKAAQEGKPVAPARPAGAPPKPRLPGKPAPKAAAKEGVSRRSMLAVLTAPFTVAWTSMTAIGGLWGLATARFMMPNMVLELPSKFKVGPPSDFPPGTVSEKYKATRGVWLVHSEAYDGRNIIYALASVCTHLGCTPNWLEGEQKFKCPCHGSGFYISGVNFEGPAPRPLERVGLRLAEDGQLEVDKSLKFQEELGQWSDSKSYFAIS